jgi:VIT1/CCC1 family predicted Fe2+/Mn2+ transporter
MNAKVDSMTEENSAAESEREPILNPVDRVSEMLFGLFMALTFVGAVSIANSGTAEIQEMLAAAIGCNLAWGLVDAVMYLVRTITDRGRALTLTRSVRAAADVETGRALIRSSLSTVVGKLVTDTEIEPIRARIVALSSVPERPHLKWRDLLAAVSVFLLVVAATFPVVLPFVMTDDVGLAKNVSRAIALTMLFFGGVALGRYAGYGSWKVGFMMAGLGTALITAVIALGG